jgi:dihydroorotase
MTQKFDLLIRGATCVSHAGIEVADIGVRQGRTAAIGNLAGSEADETIDARGLHLLPGVIDTQVHFREPGAEAKEDLATGSLAAVLGGVTGVFEMPNTKPTTVTAAALADKVARAEGRMWCDFAFYMGASAENASKLGALERLPGCCGVKVFMGSSTGDLLVWEDDKLEEVLRNGNRRVAIHAEDEMRLRARKPIAEEGRVADHPLWRDEETALMATRRILELARRTGRRIHVLHVTTSEEMALLADYKDVASVEATPQHLTLEAPDCYKRLGTYAQMNPPVRDARHRAAIWQALGQGIVDVIGSDHAPHLKAEKEKPYPQSPSGMPGVQTLLPLLLNHLNEGRLSLERLVDLTSAGAQRLFNLAGKGRLAVGYDGDYTLVDLKKNWVIEETWLASKCGWSPFTGMSITGQPVGTIIRGARVMWQGEVAGTPLGRPIRFQDTLVQG